MSMHPPADRRCQIYLGSDGGTRYLDRCQNDGVQWVKWGGCNCADPDSDVCEGDYSSWECDGNHVVQVVTS